METKVFPVAVTMTNWSIVDKLYREYFNVTPSTSFDFNNNDPMGLAILTGSTDHVNITIGIVTEQELFLDFLQNLELVFTKKDINKYQSLFLVTGNVLTWVKSLERDNEIVDGIRSILERTQVKRLIDREYKRNSENRLIKR